MVDLKNEIMSLQKITEDLPEKVDEKFQNFVLNVILKYSIIIRVFAKVRF